MPPVKQKLTNKSFFEKCKALKDLYNGMPRKGVAAKYGVPRNLVSTWVKSKHKLTVQGNELLKKKYTWWEL